MLNGAMKINNLLLIISLIFLIILSGCVTTQPYSKFYKDPNIDINSYSKFYFCPDTRIEDEPESSLIFKIINNIIKDQLITKGYIFVEHPEEADFLVSTLYQVPYKEHYVPPETTYTPIKNYEYTTFESPYLTGSYQVIGSGTKATTEKTTYLPVTTGGYYEGYFYPLIHIDMYDLQKVNPFKPTEQIIKINSQTLFFSGSAVDSSKENDITKFAPTLISTILKNFPSRIK